jgi:hypothetical protein
MPLRPALIRNSIPQQNLSGNGGLSVKKWNAYINILKEQANANTRFLESLDIEVVRAIGGYIGGSVPALVVTPSFTAAVKTAMEEVYPEIRDAPPPDDFVLTFDTPSEDYNRSDYGKVLNTFEI